MRGKGAIFSKNSLELDTVGNITVYLHPNARIVWRGNEITSKAFPILL